LNDRLDEIQHASPTAARLMSVVARKAVAKHSRPRVQRCAGGAVPPRRASEEVVEIIDEEVEEVKEEVEGEEAREEA